MNWSKADLSALDQVHSLVVVDATKPDHPITYVNHAFELLTGYSAEETVGRNCRFLQGADTDRETVANLRAALAKGERVRCELLNYRKDGTSFWNDLAIDPIRGKNGELTAFIAVQYDASDKRASLLAWKEAEARLGSLLTSLPGFMFEAVVGQGRPFAHSYTSPSAGRALGMAPERNVTLEEIVSWASPTEGLPIGEFLAQATSSKNSLQAEFRLAPPSGKEGWFRFAVSPRSLPDGTTVLSGLALDIGEERSSKMRAAYLESHDPLTKLPNRHLFHTRTAEAVISLTPDSSAAVLLVLDLDNFQALNDSLGVPTADRVLRRVGLRMAEFAEAQGGLAGRLGGDEFGALLRAHVPEHELTRFAEALGAMISAPFHVNGQEILVSACIGAALLPPSGVLGQHGASEWLAEELLKRAQLALTVARRSGPGVAKAYTQDLDDRYRHGKTLSNSMSNAIHENQFELHYQPQVRISTGEIIGLEALVRWRHPELGFQRPDVFIPLAEESGLIIPLGAEVARMAMQQQRLWVLRGLQVPRIAINVSGIQLKRSGFVEMIRSVLEKTGAQAADFEIELTETTLLDASSGISSQLAELRALGFTLAIDDFGAGQSSLKYLREFPVDRLKIDQSFVRNLAPGSSDGPIVKSIISLGRALGVEVLAEGVETRMQVNFLRKAGCHVCQGYFFSTPLCAEDLGWMLSKRTRLPVGDQATRYGKRRLTGGKQPVQPDLADQ